MFDWITKPNYLWTFLEGFFNKGDDNNDKRRN